MGRLAWLLGLLSFAHIVALGQVTQQFTGVVSGGNSGAPGFFGTPNGTVVSGSFTVTTSYLGTPASFGIGNEWVQVPTGSIPNNNSDSITAQSANGSFTVTNLLSVELGEIYRADLEYGAQYGAGTLPSTTGSLNIACQNSPNLPIDVSAFPLTIPAGCTAQVDFSSASNTYVLYITLTSLGSATPAAPMAQLIDPVSSGYVFGYTGGASISTDTDLLASGGTEVMGAAADGVSQALIRIPATQVGQQFTLTLLNETGAVDTVAADGGVFALSGGPSGPTLSITSVSTVNGPMAFAGYIAPIDFSRSSNDNALSSRQLTLQISSVGSSSSQNPILLVRPPVFLIHGLWGDPSDWQNFQGLLTSTAISNKISSIGYADYSDFVGPVLNTSPSYLINTPLNIRKNNLGIQANSEDIESDLIAKIHDYGIDNNVAAVQADVVGQSLGGDMAKGMGLLPDFINSNNYESGYIHKLITIGTPHLGSQLALFLLNGTSDCSRGILALAQMYSFNSATIGLSTFSGAVGDLQGSDTGTTLGTLHTTAMPFPMAYLGGQSNSQNRANLATPGSISAMLSSLATAGCPQDTIATLLTPNGWPTLFSPDMSDSAVSLDSQGNGGVASLQMATGGVVHSRGIEMLGFIGPAELDHQSGLDEIVVNLLNDPTLGASFHVKGQPQ